MLQTINVVQIYRSDDLLLDLNIVINNAITRFQDKYYPKSLGTPSYYVFQSFLLRDLLVNG